MRRGRFSYVIPSDFTQRMAETKKHCVNILREIGEAIRSDVKGRGTASNFHLMFRYYGEMKMDEHRFRRMFTAPVKNAGKDYHPSLGLLMLMHLYGFRVVKDSTDLECLLVVDFFNEGGAHITRLLGRDQESVQAYAGKMKYAKAEISGESWHHTGRLFQLDQGIFKEALG